jgi:hypothetical protein
VKSGSKMFSNFLYYARIMDINNLYLLTIKLATFLFATYFREKTLAMLGNALLLLKSRSGLLMIWIKQFNGWKVKKKRLWSSISCIKTVFVHSRGYGFKYAVRVCIELA